MRDDDGDAVGPGDWITFSYGIPPVRVYARVSSHAVLTVTVLGNHKPGTMALANLRKHVGCWYKYTGPIPSFDDV